MLTMKNLAVAVAVWCFAAVVTSLTAANRFRRMTAVNDLASSSISPYYELPPPTQEEIDAFLAQQPRQHQFSSATDTADAAFRISSNPKLSAGIVQTDTPRPPTDEEIRAYLERNAVRSIPTPVEPPNQQMKPSVTPPIQLTTALPRWRRLFPDVTLMPQATATVSPLAKQIFENVDFRLVQQMCQTKAGLNRARQILSSSAQIVNSGSGDLNQISALGKQIAPAAMEQSLCRLLGMLNRPESLVNSLLNGLFDFLPFSNKNP